jgi:hypothetical protein
LENGQSLIRIGQSANGAITKQSAISRFQIVNAATARATRAGLQARAALSAPREQRQ